MEEDHINKNLDESWRMVLSNIQLELSPILFRAWFQGSKLTHVGEGIAKIKYSKAYMAEYVDSHFRNIVKKAIKKALGLEDIEPVFESDPQGTAPEEEYTEPLFSSGRDTSEEDSVNRDFESSTNLQKASSLVSQPTTTDALEAKVIAAGLNPRYRFENFIVGGGTQLAHAAALAVADAPGFAYNPLFIYGGVGLGKTHLLQAIGYEILKKRPSANVLYIPGETFLNELVHAIRVAKNVEFREKYRNIDVLIIDDIQILSDKEKTQDELFHTYNVLYQSNKQIVLAADRPPREIQNLTDRLRSRFEGGMVADIKSPDFETRLAILQKKAQDRNIFLPEYTLRIIANLESDNVRDLEGSLAKINTHFYLNNNSLTEEEIQRILHKDIESKRKLIKPKDILQEVATVFEVSVTDIKGSRRTANLALARQVVMFLLRTELGLTLEDAANEVKRKDHTTVIHAIDKIQKEISVNEAFAEKIDSLKKALNRLKARQQN